MRSLRSASIVLTSAALLTGCMLFVRPPENLDYSRTRASEAGRYRATIKPQGNSIPQGKLQRWTLHVETTAGVPVDSGDFAVDGGMPQHGHGLPTRPQVTRELADGTYLVEGMKFSMTGWWEIKLAIQTADAADKVTFNRVVTDPTAR
jgi:hypothetical protein